MISYEVGKHAFYIPKENKVLATSLSGVIEAMNIMFYADINPLRSKVSATSRNFIELNDGVSLEAGFGYKGLYQFFKDKLNIPINVEKSFARTSSSWHIFLEDNYKEAYDRYVTIENETESKNEDENEIVDKKDTEETTKEGEQNNENHDRTQEKEDLSSDAGLCATSGSTEDQEGASGESGTPILEGTGSGAEPTVSFEETSQQETPQEEAKQKPTKRGRKKAEPTKSSAE